MSSSDEDDDIILGATVAAVFVVVAVVEANQLVDKTPYVNRDEERRRVLKRMYEESDVSCRELLRMNRQTFKRLCAQLRTKGLRDGRAVTVEEKVASFLHIIGHDFKNRAVKFEFIRSGETIHRSFHSVLDVVIKLSCDVIQPATSEHSPRMETNPRLWAIHYFQDCIGAIDGTFIDATVPMIDQPRYRNRKQNICQNVLAVCSFDMKFTYVMAGWEGSAHDSRILRASMASTLDPLTVPPRKYYLADAGFPHAPGFITPYRGVRYHLSEHKKIMPSNAKELFNYRHSSLRNVIKRMFGVLKKRFACLRTAPFFNVETQTKVVIACCTIHNFIMEVDPSDSREEFGSDSESESEDEEEEEEEIPTTASTSQSLASLEPTRAWTNFRDRLAARMWNEYDFQHP